VYPQNFHFDGCGATQFVKARLACEGMDGTRDRFQLYGALLHPWNGNQFARHRVELPGGELILLETEFVALVFRDGVLTSERGEGFHLSPHIR
jgi:hypothetical protein